MVTIVEFLLARIEEDEERASLVTVQSVDMSDNVPKIRHRAIRDRVLAECEAKRRIVEWHQSWPVLVETPVEMDPVTAADDPATMAMRVSQRLAWLTEQEYRTKFGDEPPNAPMIAALAAVYADHPDYDEEWRP